MTIDPDFEKEHRFKIEAVGSEDRKIIMDKFWRIVNIDKALVPSVFEKEIWNEAIEKAAEEAYHVCKNDLYVREVGLEKVCAAEIRKLKK